MTIPTTTLEPLLVDERAAARLLGVCPRTIYGLRRGGKLRAVRIGSSVRYDVADLRALIAAYKDGGTP